MQISCFIDMLGVEFFTGVPDSQLKGLCDYLYAEYGIGDKHIIAANEGNAVALAAGYHLSTGKIPLVYLQNSGIGNILNPAVSLLHPKVYAIPCIFVVGWRGEPGVRDEPQHIFQGAITLRLLEDIGITSFVVDAQTTAEDIKKQMAEFDGILKSGGSVAFVIKKGSLEFDQKVVYENQNILKREDVIRRILAISKDDLIISTTGKASRELFELREENQQGHKYDFLTVGSMGHSSSIALGVALNQPEKRVWCLDGDGAALMHMGAMAVIGNQKPANMIHVIINNGAHETVGGQPTAVLDMNLSQIALGCGYSKAFSVDCMEELDTALNAAKTSQALTLIEVKCAIGSRSDLGRPTTSTLENKEGFMSFLTENCR